MKLELKTKLSSSFGYKTIKEEYELGLKRTGKLGKGVHPSKPFLVVSTMSIERYYSSILDETSPMTEDAAAILENQDFMGFFKTCGTSYVRSIRRAQELTTIFKFHATSRNLAQEFAAGLKIEGTRRDDDNSFLDKPKFSSIKSSLEIRIVAAGLGLNDDGESTLVSTSLSNYDDIIKFAFNSFTQNIDDTQYTNVGMIHGIELVPWVDNPSFQIASKILTEDLVIPMPRSLIAKAIANRNGPSVFVNNDETRSQFRCRSRDYEMDKYGYCCESTVLFDRRTNRYITGDGDGSKTLICKPTRNLDKSVVKNNILNNGEFVSRLDSVIRYKLNQLFTLEKCVSSVNDLAKRHEHFILQSSGLKYDKAIDEKFAVKELKMALDPFDDYSLIKHMGNELDEFIDMFYRPCVAALFGTNHGPSPAVDPKYFMAYGWLTHTACSKLSCLTKNMRWSRDGSGCVKSIIAGARAAPLYNSTSDIECKKDEEATGDFEVCKYKTSDLVNFQDDVNNCWQNKTIIPYHLMKQFCMPEIIGEKVNEERQHQINVNANRCTR